ncbi:MAG: acireductone synthase [Cyanobacteria bacterium Co-bin8]|nr:acireductone synthase [Cyanobacteria bacterium Co-bin8]
MAERISDQVEAILLDIEGTTTPVDFVFGVLFPFARDQAEGFLQAHGREETVQADLALLRQEYEADRVQGLDLPDWQRDEPTASVPYIQYLIGCDRKSTGLKSLQGKLWNQGYADGSLQSQIYPDVYPAFKRWKAAGKALFIFSSGSIQAQKLLFAHTEQGDLTTWLSGYFDTTTGSKKEAESYQKIAATIGLPPEQILFISDIAAELQAAQAAGMKTLFSYRPGNPSKDAEGFPLIENFDII